jgi:nitroreductase
MTHRDAPAVLPSDIEALERIYAARFSCRAFLPRPVDRPTIERILRLAQRTASWCNSQPWQVVIASGEAVERFRQALLDEAGQPPEPTDLAWPRAYEGVYLERRRECGRALYESVGIARGDREAARAQARENFRLFGAPHVAIVTTDDALGVYGAIDCGAWVGSFMAAARAIGVACIAQAALGQRPGVIRRHFDLAPSRRIVCGISFGYADEAHPANAFRTGRAPLDEAVRFVG